MTLAVIGAGFGRTGTLSFKQALEELGFGPCHHMQEIMTGAPDLDAWASAAAGTLTDWDRLYGDWGSVCDFPHCVFYAELAAFYPEAKVVLTERDPESWYTSASETIFSPDNVERFASTTGGSAGADGPSLWSSLTTIISRAIDVRTRPDKDAMIAAFLAHNEAVKATIGADRLLVYRVSEGWEPLCAFLGVEVPSTDFPRVNTTEEFRQRLQSRSTER